MNVPSPDAPPRAIADRQRRHRDGHPPAGDAAPGHAMVGPAWRLVGALPLALPAALAGYGAVAIALLLLGHFTAALTLPLGLVAAVLAGGAAMRAGTLEAADDPRRGRRAADLLALLGAAAWVLENLRLASQNISVFRDPATYAVTAQWLVHHPTAVIDGQAAVFGKTPGVSFASSGFNALPGAGQVQPQGAHLVQTLMASAGWIGGDSWVLRANVLIGGVALLAVYAFGRRVAHPLWALGAVSVLAATLPMAEFSRSVYTEPLAMVFAFGAFALLSVAHRSQRTGVLVAGGLTLGATTMTRIDGLFSLIMVVPFVSVLLGQALVRRDRRDLVRTAAVVLPVLVVAALAVLDLQQLAPVYYRDLGSQVHQIYAGLLAAAVVGVVVVTVLAVRPASVARLTGSWRRVVPPVAAGGVCVGMAVLASRPLWTAGHGLTGGGYSSYVVFLQKARHLPLDGTRDYSELTVKWLSWYVGVTAVVLGTIGCAWLLARALRTLDPPLLLAVGSVTVTAALYLVKPSIVPDQLWASRRLLPLVFPGVLLGAAFVLTQLAARSRALGVLALVLGLVIVGETVSASSPLWGVRQYVPELAEVTALCAAVPDDGAIIVGPALASTMLETVRSYCDVPTATVKKLQPATIRAAASAVGAHGRRLYVVSTTAASLPGVDPEAKPFSSVRWFHWNATLTTPAFFAGHEDRDLYLAVVSDDGTLKQVPASTLKRS